MTFLTSGRSSLGRTACERRRARSEAADVPSLVWMCLNWDEMSTRSSSAVGATLTWSRRVRSTTKLRRGVVVKERRAERLPVGETRRREEKLRSMVVRGREVGRWCGRGGFSGRGP